MFSFETTVCGIPCIVEYDWQPGYPGNREEPAEPEGPDRITIRDRNGYLAPWLERKLFESEDAIARLDDEIFQHHRDIAEGL